MALSIKLLSFWILAVSAVAACGVLAHDPAEEKSPQAVTVGMHEMARQIRLFKSWQILGAQPRREESGYWHFRFKLLRSDGTVRIIYFDPRDPDLKRLEQ